MSRWDQTAIDQLVDRLRYDHPHLSINAQPSLPFDDQVDHLADHPAYGPASAAAGRVTITGDIGDYSLELGDQHIAVTFKPVDPA